MTARAFEHLVESSGGWFFGILAIIVLVAKNTLKSWLTKVADGVSRTIYDILAGSRVLNQAAIRKYRIAVQATYSTFQVPFADDLQLDMQQIYVPLRRLLPSGQEAKEDVYAGIRAESCSVVLGPPGAGKSMLLRNSMLVWSRTRHSRSSLRIPVLVELRRCDGSNSLEGQIVDALKRENFRGGRKFVDRAIRRGDLTVLFDGLDEVATENRPRVANQLQELAEKCRGTGCQLIVTCRSAIYEGQLRPQFRYNVRVAEFDDAQIHKFLMSWPMLRNSRSVNQLISALDNAPRIKQLARNPLLLTMIAFLYSDVRPGEPFILPSSRTQFYKEAVGEFLRMKRERSYREPEKRAVLQRLALVAHDAPSEIRDRMSLTYAKVIQEITGTMASLNRSPDDAGSILDEIVERSGLLNRIDGGERYQFAHLTLQEFLAAAELADNPDGLLDRLAFDHDAWREPAKLWCGLVSYDCSRVILRIFDVDPVLAFECAVEATKVSDDLMRQVMVHFEKELARDDGVESSVIAAFAAAAADPRPRGKYVFNYIANLARSSGSNSQSAAIAILSKTNVPTAATVLAELPDRSRTVHSALIGMGDLAVPALATRAKVGYADAVSDLARIGTVKAAVALVGLLGRVDSVAYRSAWALGVLLREDDIVAGLNENEVELSESLPRIDWLSRPFQSEISMAQQEIMGRVGFLIVECPSRDVPQNAPAVTVAIALPLGAIKASGSVRGKELVLANTPWEKYGFADFPQLMTRKGASRGTVVPGSAENLRICFSDLLTDPVDDDVLDRLGCALIESSGVPVTYAVLVRSLERVVRIELFRIVFGPRSSLIDSDDWVGIAEQSDRTTDPYFLVASVGYLATVPVFLTSLILQGGFVGWWIPIDFVIALIASRACYLGYRRHQANRRALRNPLRILWEISKKAAAGGSSIIAE